MKGIILTDIETELIYERSPISNRSKGEELVSFYLDTRFIRYEEQKTFPECFYINELPFDFYLPDKNVLIEFQGIQHEKFVPFFHGDEDGFIEQQIKDELKKDFAKDNNIRFVEVWYYELSDIKLALDKKMNL